MKKFSIFAMTLLFTTTFSSGVFAAPKKSTSKGNPKVNMSSALGKNLDVENPSTQKKSEGSGNIFYDATLGKKQAPSSVPTATPTPPPVDTAMGSGILNMAEVQKNQQKEEHIAKGKVLFVDTQYQKALDEFKNAQSISNDYLTQRWVAVANNRIKIQELNKKIEAITGASLIKR